MSSVETEEEYYEVRIGSYAFPDKQPTLEEAEDYYDYIFLAYGHPLRREIWHVKVTKESRLVF